MAIITYKWIFLRMTKTGSTNIQRVIQELVAAKELDYRWKNIFFTGHQIERFDELNRYQQSLPIICSMRNPFAWYYSFWLWYTHSERQGHLAGERSIDPNLSFEEWVRENPTKMVDEMKRIYPPNPRVIRVETWKEELVEFLEEVKEPLSQAAVSTINTFPDQNANRDRRRPYREYYTPELEELVLEGAAPIFDAYYRSRSFPCI